MSFQLGSSGGGGGGGGGVRGWGGGAVFSDCCVQSAQIQSGKTLARTQTIFASSERLL